MRTSVDDERDGRLLTDATPDVSPRNPFQLRDVPVGAWLGLLLVLAAALRFLRLGGQSLWLDEVLSVTRSRTILVDGFDAQLLNGHGPLFFYLVAPLLPLQPDEFLLRLPSALFGVGLVLAMYFLGKEFGGRRGGLITAAVTAVSPFAIWYSQEARYINLFILLAAISLVFLRRLERGGRRDLFLYVVSTVLMLLSFVGGVFLLLAQNLWVFLFSNYRASTLRRWILAQAFVALVFVPWLIRAYEINVNMDLVSDLGSSEFAGADFKAGYPRSTQPIQIGYVFLVFGVGYSFGPSTQDLHHDLSLQTVKTKALQVMAAVVLIGLVGLAGLVGSVRRSWRDATLLVLCVVCPILGAYVVASVTKIAFNVRYTSAAFPAFVLLFSAGLVWWKDRFRWGGLLLLASVGAVLAVSLFNLYDNPQYFKEDSRRVATLLQQARRPGERLLVGASVIPFEYYYHQPFERWNEVRLITEPPLPAQEAEDSTRLWVAATRTWQSRDFQSFLNRLSSCYPVETRYDLPGYEVLVYRVGSPQRPVTCVLEESGSDNARKGS